MSLRELFFKAFSSGAEFASLDQEAKLRSKEFAANGYVSHRKRIAVFLFLLSSLALFFVLITPPTDFAEDVRNHPDKYKFFPQAKIYFSKSIRPVSGAKKHPVTLPFRGVESLAGYAKDSVWYEFEIDTSDQSNIQTALMILKVWGRVLVYVDGELKDFGTDLSPVIPLLKQRSVVSIRSDISSSIRKAPITALFPPVLGNPDELRKVVQEGAAQVESPLRSTMIYCIAILLFGTLFIAYPKKPELFSFLIFLAVSSIQAMLYYFNASSSVPLLSRSGLLIAMVATDAVLSISLLAFSLFFFRAHPKTVFRKASFLGSSLCILVAPITAAGLGAFPMMSSSQTGHLAVNVMSFFFQAWALTPRLLHIVTNKNSSRIPLERRVACFVVASATVVYYALNIFDFFLFFSSVVTFYTNGLIFNLVLCVTVAFEIARAEHNQNVLSSLLPKEVKETLHLKEKQSEQKGFVVLVDAVGYSAVRSRFDSASIRSSYIEAMAERILQPLIALKDADVSILNCTGDGIYCAIRGEATRENYLRSLRFCEQVLFSGSRGGEIGFRAAVGFGVYGVSVIELGSIRKEFVAGNILIDLSRVIGGNAGEVRVLLTPDTEQFLDSHEPESSTDKHGFNHRFAKIKCEKQTAA